MSSLACYTDAVLRHDDIVLVEAGDRLAPGVAVRWGDVASWVSWIDRSARARQLGLVIGVDPGDRSFWVLWSLPPR